MMATVVVSGVNAAMIARDAGLALGKTCLS